MNREKKLIKDTVIYSIGNFGSKILVFLMLPIYTSYFNVSEYGKWDIISTTIYLIIPFITLELISASYRWLIVEKCDKNIKKIFTTGLNALVKSLCIFNIISIIILSFIRIDYGILCVIMINTNVILSYLQQCTRGLGNNKLFIVSGILNTILLVLFNLLFIYIFKLGIETFIYSTIIANFSLIIIIWKKGKLKTFYQYNTDSKELFKELCRYSIPMIPSVVSWWIMNVSDRYIINFSLGVEYNGLYAISNKFPSLIIMISSVFFMAWKDNAIKEYKIDNDNSVYYTKIFRYYFRFMSTVILILLAMVKILTKVLVSDMYFISWKYSAILIVATLFDTFSEFWAVGYHATKQTKSILKTYIIGALTNLFINIILINYIGLYSAAISTLIGLIVMWILRIKDKQKSFSININYKDSLIMLPIIFIFLLLQYKENINLDISLICIAIGMFFYMNKNIIKFIFKFLKLKLKNNYIIRD